MNDIGLFIIDDCIQPVIESGDLLGDDSLETAVLISLFTDQRVSVAELPSGEESSSRRGWWGDLFADIESDQIGSKLWLYQRAKRTQDNLTQIETTATESLKWLLDDGVAKSVSVEASFDDDNDSGVIIEIEITKPDDTENRFKFFWDQQQLKRA
jgi:phage gp46-like protein